VSQEPSDRDLVARANQGDAAALEELYRRHRDWVVGLAWRFTGNEDDALDILQETFTYFFQQFPGFQLTGAMRSYLFPVVKHRCISLFRKRKKVVSLETARERGVEAAVELRWEPATGDYARLLQRLPEQQREVVQLRFGLGFKLNEIAEALDIALGTVKSRLHNALKSLRISLEEEESS